MQPDLLAFHPGEGQHGSLAQEVQGGHGNGRNGIGMAFVRGAGLVSRAAGGTGTRGDGGRSKIAAS